MPTPKLTQKAAFEAVRAVETELRAGYRPSGMNGNGPAAITKAAETLGISRSTLHGRLAGAKQYYDLEPDEALYRPQHYHQPVPRTVVYEAPPPAPDVMRPVGGSERVLVIGDLHQDPRHPDRLEVLTWIARYASDERFDRIIQIGDWSTWDSVNFHDKNDTFKARVKPSIRADMDNLTASHRAFRLGMANDYKPKLDIVLGNHENRLERFENANPESHGTFTLERDQIFARFGWRTRPYSEIMYVQGVGFSHHPVNGSGKAFGGETGPQRAANKSTVSIVSGHTHRKQMHDAGKIGPVGSISMVEVGCALPWGTVESYAKHGITGWWWGVVSMTVSGGSITDVGFVSMLTLEKKYANVKSKEETSE